MKLIGIDLSTDPNKTGVSARDEGRIYANLCRGSSDRHTERLLEHCSDAYVVAVDAPFGWPKPFIEALAGYYIGGPVNREDSWELLCEWTEGDSLRKHALAVEAAMRAYARAFGEDEEKWGITGLLHDMDYEKHPTPAEHPMTGVRELASRGYPEDILEAIKGHADYLDVPRESLLARTLYAVDELSGFVVACALVRPEGLEGLKARSVRKKMKQKSFAASVSREDMMHGAEELGVDLNEHIDFVVAALEERSDALGLPSRSCGTHQ